MGRPPNYFARRFLPSPLADFGELSRAGEGSGVRGRPPGRPPTRLASLATLSRKGRGVLSRHLSAIQNNLAPVADYYSAGRLQCVTGLSAMPLL